MKSLSTPALLLLALIGFATRGLAQNRAITLSEFTSYSAITNTKINSLSNTAALALSGANSATTTANNALTAVAARLLTSTFTSFTTSQQTVDQNQNTDIANRLLTTTYNNNRTTDQQSVTNAQTTATNALTTAQGKANSFTVGTGLSLASGTLSVTAVGSGGGSGTVLTDGTLTGNGSSGSPLSASTALGSKADAINSAFRTVPASFTHLAGQPNSQLTVSASTTITITSQPGDAGQIALTRTNGTEAITFAGVDTIRLGDGTVRTYRGVLSPVAGKVNFLFYQNKDGVVYVDAGVRDFGPDILAARALAQSKVDPSFTISINGSIPVSLSGTSANITVPVGGTGSAGSGSATIYVDNSILGDFTQSSPASVTAYVGQYVSNAIAPYAKLTDLSSYTATQLTTDQNQNTLIGQKVNQSFTLSINGSSPVSLTGSSASITIPVGSTSAGGSGNATIYVDNSIAGDFTQTSPASVTAYVANYITSALSSYTVAQQTTDANQNVDIGNRLLTSTYTTNRTADQNATSAAQTSANNNTTAINSITANAGSLGLSTTGLKVITGNSLSSVVGSIDQALLAARATGILSGGSLAINSDATRFNVGAGSGTILNLSDPTNPIYTKISWPASTSILPAATAGNASYVYYDASGALQQITSKPSNSQMRLLGVFVGKVQTNASGTVVAVQSMTDPVQGAANLIGDLANGIGVFVQNGARITGTSGLSLALGSGQLYDHGGNFQTQPTDPSTANIATSSAKGFRYLTQSGASVGNDIFVVDPSKYDNAGTITTVPASGMLGVTRVTNQRVYLYPSGNMRIQYGQKFYESMGDATAAIGTEPFVVNPNQMGNSVLIAVLTMQVTTTATNDITKAIITPASRFGEIGGSGSSAVASMSATMSITGSNGVTAVTSGNVVNVSGVPASTSAVGVIRVGTGLAVAADGLLSVTATSGSGGSGVVYVDNSIEGDGTTTNPLSVTTYVASKAGATNRPGSVSAIVTAMNSATLNADVYPLPGRYNFTGTTLVWAGKNNVNLHADKDVEFYNTDGGTIIIFNGNNTNTTIDGITFTSSFTQTASSADLSTSLLYTNEQGTNTGVEVKNCKFSAPFARMNLITTSAYSSTLSGGSGQGKLQQNLSYHDNEFGPGGRMGIELTSHTNEDQKYTTIFMRNVSIKNNYFHDLGLLPRNGDGVFNGMGPSVSGPVDLVDISKNVLIDCNLLGIETAGAKRVSITDNLIDYVNQTFTGISVSDNTTRFDARDINIVGNHIRSKTKGINMYRVAETNATSNFIKVDQDTGGGGTVYIQECLGITLSGGSVSGRANNTIRVDNSNQVQIGGGIRLKNDRVNFALVSIYGTDPAPSTWVAVDSDVMFIKSNGPATTQVVETIGTTSNITGVR